MVSFFFLYKKKGQLLPLAREEINLKLHGFPKLGVRNMNIEPSRCSCYTIGVNFISVFLILNPCLTEKFSARDWDGIKQVMELTMVDDWHCADKRVSDCSSVSFIPVPTLEANMH